VPERRALGSAQSLERFCRTVGARARPLGSGALVRPSFARSTARACVCLGGVRGVHDDGAACSMRVRRAAHVRSCLAASYEHQHMRTAGRRSTRAHRVAHSMRHAHTWPRERCIDATDRRPRHAPATSRRASRDLAARLPCPRARMSAMPPLTRRKHGSLLRLCQPAYVARRGCGVVWGESSEVKRHGAVHASCAAHAGARFAAVDCFLLSEQFVNVDAMGQGHARQGHITACRRDAR
jgi:hypothetical protein